MTAEKSASSLEHEIAGEKAGSIGRSGRRLRSALDNLQQFDQRMAGAQRSDLVARARLVKAAADAFWMYIVQREALGLIDADYIRREYGVPVEVWRLVGPE